jgi:hypothetical protein
MVKGTMSRDFLLQEALESLRIFSKILRDIRKPIDAPSVPPTPGANFATCTAGVVDSVGKFAPGVNDTGSKHKIYGSPL